MKLKTILADDEPWCIKQFEDACADNDIELTGKFNSAKEALAFAKNHTIDLAVLDIKMQDMDGIELGRKLKGIYPNLVLVYITAYEEYLKDAILDVEADHYMVKPYRKEDIDKMIAKAKLLSARQRKRVVVRTFGEFDIFIDGHLVEFKNRKAKELLAVCIDRGGEVTMNKVIDLLWENRNYDTKVKCLYRKAVAYLNMLFKEYGTKSVFSNGRGICHVNRHEISCDYYEVLDGKSIADTAFDGRYMASYPWGEETCGKLCSMAAAYLSK